MTAQVIAELCLMGAILASLVLAIALGIDLAMENLEE